MILYCGSLVPEGLSEFIRAFILADIPSCEFHIYGAGIFAGEMKNMISGHANIHYNGVVDNASMVAELQQKANLLVNPRPTSIFYARYSFPSKVMEYLASGTPVLTTRLPGIPAEYFDYAYSFDGETAEEMAQTLKSVMSLSDAEKAELSARARTFVVEKKNSTIQAERILQLAEKCKYAK